MANDKEDDFPALFMNEALGNLNDIEQAFKDGDALRALSLLEAHADFMHTTVITVAAAIQEQLKRKCRACTDLSCSFHPSNNEEDSFALHNPSSGSTYGSGGCVN